MIRPIRLRNGTVLPMEARQPGSNDLVSHTLRHFVREGTYFESVPGGHLTSAEARSRLMAARVPSREISALPVSHDKLDSRWSGWDRRAAVQGIHDVGYGPRYIGLVKQAKFPGDSGAKWEADHGQYQGGYSFFPLEWNVWVSASWDPRRRELRVVTAHDRAPKVGDGVPRRKQVDEENDIIDKLLRRR